MKTDIPTNGSMVKNHISLKTGVRIQCNTENFVPIVVSGLSSSSSSSSHPSTSMTHSRQESNHLTSSSSSSTSPTTTVLSDSETREREDLRPLNGSSHICAKQKLLRKHKGARKSSWSQIGNLKSIYTDNSLEFGKACEDLSWNHCTSTSHRSETNGIAERAVRRVKEGTSAVLLQSGLNENWWADSMKCYTYLRNIQDLSSDGKTPCERRFGKPFIGPIIPLGSLVEYYPIFAKDQSRIHQFGKKVLPGLFLGYALYAGVNLERVTYW